MQISTLGNSWIALFTPRVFDSDDGGDSWTRLGDGLPSHGEYYRRLAVGASGDVYVSMSEGVFRHNTASREWELVFSDVAAMKATTRGKLLLGTRGHVFASADSGTSWEMLDSGIPDGVWVSHIEEGTDGILYVAGSGLGVYRSSRLENVTIDRTSGGTTSRDFAIYPNPFGATTNVSLSLDGYESVRIAAFDVLGREMDVLYDVAGPYGSATVTWTPTGIAAGIYYIRILRDGVTDSRSVVYLK